MSLRIKEVRKISDSLPIGYYSQNKYLSESHNHLEYEIFILDEGEVLFGIENLEVSLSSGNAIFLDPKTDHYAKLKYPEKEYHFFAITFDSKFFNNYGNTIQKIFENLRFFRFITLTDEIINKLKKYKDLESQKSFGYELYLVNIIIEILYYLIESKQYVEVKHQADTPKKRNINSIEVVLDYIKEHYRENITLQDILEITSYSKSHFIRLFKNNTGMNLTQYINKYRIEKSCLDLIYTDKNITEVAIENGFNNLQYFSKIFKDYMNCTPKKYQSNGRNMITPKK